MGSLLGQLRQISAKLVQTFQSNPANKQTHKPTDVDETISSSGIIAATNFTVKFRIMYLKCDIDYNLTLYSLLILCAVLIWWNMCFPCDLQMVVEQKKLKRQSQILMQSSSPSHALQEALSQVTTLTQDLESQRLEHQHQVCAKTG